jgi:hypothetical protein
MTGISLIAMALQPHQLALFCTVALLVVTAYFLLGSIPLLVLKHDDPVDSRFIRSFYVTYYRIALVTASAATASYALASRPAFAAGAAGIVVLTWVLRQRFIPRMDALGTQIRANAEVAIPGFRKIHKLAILINLAQLLGILGSLAAL